MKKTISLLLALVMIFSLAACGGSAKTETKEEAPAAEAPAAEAPAAEAPAAAAEKTPEDYTGTLTIYSPHDSDPLNDGVAAFEAAYPNVHVEVIADGTSNLVNKINAEKANPIADGLTIKVPLRRPYTGAARLSARPEQLFFAESGMPGTVQFSTFLGDFIEYEVQLSSGQSLTVNEYTKDTTTVHENGEQVFLNFDPEWISVYEAESGEVITC